MSVSNISCHVAIVIPTDRVKWAEYVAISIAGASSCNSGALSKPPAGPSQAPNSLRGVDFQWTLNIAVIDSFSDSTHGNEIASSLLRGGADAGLSGKVQLEKFDVRGGSVGQINTHLESIIQKVLNGETIDAVNISQQALNSTPETSRTSQLIEQLSALGIPVAVAAGNGGSNAHNYLTGKQSFNVSSANQGVLNATSGRGNIISEGMTTSFATANLAPLLALRHRLGLSNQAMRNELTRSL